LPYSIRLGRPQTPDVSALMRVEEEEKDGGVDAENRISLSPQIALVVRSFWPCRRSAVDIGVDMLMKKIKRLCQRRWHHHEPVFQYVHVFWTTCSHAGTGLSRTSHPASLRFGFGSNRCREQPQVLGRKGFASTCRHMQHEWFGCPAQLQGTRELCQSQSRSLSPEKDGRIR
jgi:hypothetical protein